jgi:hypothetical protein
MSRRAFNGTICGWLLATVLLVGYGVPKTALAETEMPRTSSVEVAKIMYTVSTLGELKSLQPTHGYKNIYLEGRTKPRDGGQGIFHWDTNPDPRMVVADEKNGVFVVPYGLAADGSQGAWARQYTGAVRIEWFGGNAIPGTTDMSGAFQAACNFSDAVEGSQMVYYLGSNVTINKKSFKINGNNSVLTGVGAVIVNAASEIKSMHFKQNAGTQLSIMHHVSDYQNNDNLIICGNTFESGGNSTNIGLSINSYNFEFPFTTGMVISQNKFTGLPGAGIWSSGIQNSIISNNTFYSNKNYNIQIYSSIKNIISGNAINGGLAGITLLGTNQFFSQGNISNMITENTINNVREEGISLDCMVNGGLTTAGSRYFTEVKSVAVNLPVKQTTINISGTYDASWKYVYVLSGTGRGKLYFVLPGSSPAGWVLYGIHTKLAPGDKVVAVIANAGNVIANNTVTRAGLAVPQPTQYPPPPGYVTSTGNPINAAGILLFGNVFGNEVYGNTLVDCGIGLWGMSGVATATQQFAPAAKNKVHNNNIAGGELLAYGYGWSGADVGLATYGNEFYDNTLDASSTFISDGQKYFREQNNGY